MTNRKRAAAYSAAAGWKQRSMPTNQSLLRQWMIAIAGRVQHQIHDPIHGAARGNVAPDVNPEPPGN